MPEDKMEEFVSLFASEVLGNPNHTMRIDDDDMVEIALCSDSPCLDMVWFDCTNLSDPVLDFWKLHKGGALSDTACVIFTSTKPTPSWSDLSSVYGGAKICGMYVMTYKSNIKPGILPSQRGMYVT